MDRKVEWANYSTNEIEENAVSAMERCLEELDKGEFISAAMWRGEALAWEDVYYEATGGYLDFDNDEYADMRDTFCKTMQKNDMEWR